MAGLRPFDRAGYDRALAAGAAQYDDVIQALRAFGLPVTFIQTGGMCAAIEAALDSGHYLLLTDVDDTLAWDRSEHRGWYVGMYEPVERQTVDGPVRWAESDDGSPAEAERLVSAVLRGECYCADGARGQVG